MHSTRTAFPLTLRVALPLVAILVCATLITAGQRGSRPQILRPAPPLTYTILPGGRIELTWPRYGDSLYLERRLSGEEVFSIVGSFAASQRAYTDSTLTANALSFYRLRPGNAHYLSEYGPECRVDISLSPPPPPILTRISLDTVLVRVPDRYKLTTPLAVERKMGGIYTVVGRLTPACPTWRDGRVRTNGYQFYTLRYESDSSRAAPSRPDSILLDLIPPTDLALTYLSDHSLRLAWKPALVFPCTHEVEKRSPDTVRTFAIPTGVTLWNDTLLAYDQRCYYRVRTASGVDTSPYSATISAYYVLAAPGRLTADPVHDCIVHLSWSARDSLASFYVVERSLDSLHFQQLATVGGRAFRYADTLSGRGQTVFYRVLSMAANGRTAASAVITEHVPQFTDGMVHVPATARPGFIATPARSLWSST